MCDVDKKVGEPTKTYIISVDGKRVAVDLCESHAGPIEELVSLGTDAPLQLGVGSALVEPKPAPAKKAPTKRPATKKATTTPQRRRAKVVSLEEIEKAKQS
ncbi:DNA binding protein [Streptomyces phage Yosif]|uniref:DNA binding protein n=1 Tax=Streptomyces phage Yosif TaxID=2201421 RepID=A0A2Z4QBX6_9CAUD|nr:hypothetical protein KGG71_gp30 [Streptomyces phage Yosif]AWY07594.1 DNA binding protein [Streptomyces phage Yosif]